MMQDFMDQFNTEGFAIVENVLSKDFVKKCKNELSYAIEEEQHKYGEPSKKDYGMVLMCSMYGGTFLEVFDNQALMNPFEAILGKNCIVYAYTSSSMPPNDTNYSRRIHTDCPRYIPGYLTNVGATISLDDFTVENGATYFLPKSHTKKEAPTEEEFNANAKPFVGPAGSVCFFNALTWHRGGINKTSNWRHALTINMCRSYMKQRIDIPRSMAPLKIENMSEKCKQKLGFFSQPPASIEEYYLPIELRNYKHSAE